MQENLFSRLTQKWLVRRSLYCIVSVFILSIVCMQGALARATESHAKGLFNVHQVDIPSVALLDLNTDASSWGVYHDGGSNTGTITNVGEPSMDGNALEVALQGGDPYTGFQAYRTLPQISATTFALRLSFYFTDQTTIQGLEFTMNRWHQNQRMEWALQWEQYGDGTIQEGVPPNWRVWTGQGWQNLGITQSLALSTWHTLFLIGDIFQGKVRYLGFSCDDVSAPLSLVFPPTASSGEKVVIGTQIDGNIHEDPAQVYLDKVDLAVQ